MAVSKKSTTIPVNLGATLSALNSAAETSMQTIPQSSFQPQTAVQEPAIQTYQRETVVPSFTQQIQAVPDEPQNFSNERATRNTTAKTMISLRLLKTDKEKFQEFFREHGLSFTDGLYMAADFIEKEVNNGRLHLSKSGIQYK